MLTILDILSPNEAYTVTENLIKENAVFKTIWLQKCNATDTYREIIFRFSGGNIFQCKINVISGTV